MEFEYCAVCGATDCDQDHREILDMPVDRHTGSITGVEVELTGHDGNAMAIIGRCRQAMRRARVDPKVIEEFTTEAMSGDYDHVLQTCMKYCEVS